MSETVFELDRHLDLHLVEWIRKIKISWELTSEQLEALCHVPAVTMERYLSLSADEINSLPSVPAELEPAVALVGVFRRVQTVYPTPELQNEWLKRPNQVFEGNRPIDVMAMSPEHLAYVSYAVESGLRLQ